MLSFLFFSCETGREGVLLEKKITQVMTEFYGEKSVSWGIVEVLNTENFSLADGYKFRVVVKVADIEGFVLKNKDKPESLLNDPFEHFATVFSQNSLLIEKFKNEECKFFSHSLKLKDANREAYLFVCANLNSNLVIVDYSEH